MRVIIISHGGFAKALKETVEMIIGPNEKLSAFGLFPGQDIDDFQSGIDDAIKSGFDNGEEVLVFTDIFFGSPFNVANTLLQKYEGKFRHFTGVSAPILVEACTLMADSDLKGVCAGLKELDENHSVFVDVNAILEKMDEEE